MDRLIHQTFKIDDVLTDVTTAKLSDPDGNYGVKRNDTDVSVVDDGTIMTRTAVGTYEYTLSATANISYTAYIEFVYDGDTFYVQFDLPAVAESYGMVASYSSLLERIGFELYGLRSGFSSDQTTNIEMCMKDGLRDVYAAHSWSFFRPVVTMTLTAPYSTGTITIASGVVTLSGGTFPSWAAVGVLKIGSEYYEVDTRDTSTQVTLEDTSVTEASASSYELGRPEYDLDSTVEAIDALDFTYESGQSDFYPPIKPRSDSQILRFRQDDPYHDRPLYFGVRTVSFDATVGSRRRLTVYPTPDAAYVVQAKMQLRPTMIDSTNMYPVGGETLSQVIVESCLSAAERNFHERPGEHTKRCYGDPAAPQGSPANLGMLRLAIMADQEATCPTSLGPDSPNDDGRDTISRSVRIGDITLDGVTL